MRSKGLLLPLIEKIRSDVGTGNFSTYVELSWYILKYMNKGIIYRLTLE